MARIAASCTLSGAGKSGWPMQKLMMSLPWRASALTSASTTKAFSVPRDCARLLMLIMAYFNFEESVRPHRSVAPFRELEAPHRAPQIVWLRVARVARQRDVGAPGLLVVPDYRHGHRGSPPCGGLKGGGYRRVCGKHLDALCGCRRKQHAAVLPALHGLCRRDPEALGRLASVD